MRLGLISDVHWIAEPPPTSAGWHGAGADFPGVLERLDDALAFFIDQDVDLIALAGDLSHHGDGRSANTVLRRCGGLDVPVVVASGNHDAGGDESSLGWQVVADGVELASPTGSVYAGVLVAGVHVGSTSGWFGARLGELPDTSAWPDEPVVLVSHYPALSHAAEVSDRGLPYPGDLVDRQDLADRLLARDAPTVVVGGHVHARASRAEGSVLQLTCGALVEAPYECALVELTSDAQGALLVRRMSHRLVPANAELEPVLAPELEQWRFEPERGWGSEPVRREESLIR